MSHETPIGVGLVGFGLSAQAFHAPFVTNNPRMQLRAVVQRSGDSARRAHPQARVVRSLSALLEDESVGLVIITTPNQLHAPMARRALEAGRHVLVEKPFTITTAEADDLIRTARRSDRVLSVFQNRRFDGDFLTVQRLIDSGRLGKIVDYEARFERHSPVRPGRWRERDEPGSGILYDLGSHLIDQALVLFGLPRRVRADLRRQRPGSQVDDYFSVELEYGELRARLQASMLVRRPGPHFTVHGTLGSFVKYGMDPQEAALRNGKTPSEPIGEDDPDQWGELLLDDHASNSPERIRTLPGRYDTFFDELIEAIEGRPSSVADPVLPRETIRIIELSIESSHRGGQALALRRPGLA